MKHLLTVLIITAFIVCVSFAQGTWTQVVSGATQDILSIDFVNSTTAFALTDSKLLKSTDGGTNWTSTYIPSDYTYSVSKMTFLDASIGVVTYMKDIIRTTDGGTNWVLKTTGLTKSINEIYFIDNLKGWLVGGDAMGSGEIAKTTDGGLTWTPQTTSGSILTCVFFLNDQIGWAGGGWNELIRTTNGGTSWTAKTAPGSSNTDILFSDTLNGIMISGGSIYRTTNGATQWTKVYDGTNAPVEKLESSDASTFWAVGSAGVLLVSTDNGGTWNTQSTGVTANLVTISFADNTHGLIGGTTGTILQFSSSSSASAPVAAFAADKVSGTVPLTVQFTDLSTNTPTSWSWTFGDGGTSTNQNPSHTYSSAGTYDVSLTATNANGSNTLTKVDYIVVSTSGGGTSASLPYAQSFEDNWTDDGTGNYCVPAEYWTNTPNSGYASWRRNDYSSWSGGSYTPGGANSTSYSARFHSFLAPYGNSGSLDVAVDFSSASGSKELKFYFNNASGADQLQVFVSTDGGSNFGSILGTYTTTSGWEEKTLQLGDVNTSNGVIRFAAISDYGNDDIGLDEVRVTGGTNDVAETMMQPHAFALEQNYPNPFNPSTMITYQLNTESFVTLKVFNLLGQEIRALVQARQMAGRYSVNFDAQGLASGLYFYQLTADHHSIIKKMNLIK